MTEKAQKVSVMLQFILASAYDQLEKMSSRPCPRSNWYQKLENNLKQHDDPWPFDAGDDEDLMPRSKCYADAVAAKLDPLKPKDREEWLASVREALESVPLEVFVTTGDKAVPLIEVPGFAESVADEAEVLVAPQESDWFRGWEANARGQLATMIPRLSQDAINGMIEQWRQGKHVFAPSNLPHGQSGSKRGMGEIRATFLPETRNFDVKLQVGDKELVEKMTVMQFRLFAETDGPLCIARHRIDIEGPDAEQVTQKLRNYLRSVADAYRGYENTQ